MGRTRKPYKYLSKRSQRRRVQEIVNMMKIEIPQSSIIINNSPATSVSTLSAQESFTAPEEANFFSEAKFGKLSYFSDQGSAKKSTKSGLKEINIFNSPSSLKPSTSKGTSSSDESGCL